MNIIGKSDLLKEIEKKAILIRSSSEKPFTAERFIVALIDMVNKTPEDNKGEELSRTERILRKYVVDLEEARSLLISYIRINKHQFVDGRYMQDIVETAGKFSIENNYETVEVDVLLATILAEPSNIIKEIIRYRKKPNEADVIYLHSEAADILNSLVDNYRNAERAILDDIGYWLIE